MSWFDEGKDSQNSASQFNKRISIQDLTDNPNGAGGASARIWSTILASIPAKIVHLPSSKLGEEKFIAHQNYATQMMVVTIRYRESVNINERMRLLYRSKVYNIRAVYVPDEALKTIIIYAEEIQTQGSAR